MAAVTQGNQVRHVSFRLGATSNPDQSILDAKSADEFVKSYLDAGYVIKTSIAFGLQDGAINVFYVFTKAA